jgi:hypothetical protein
MNLLKYGKITRVLNQTADGTDDTVKATTILDMSGFDSVLFIAAFADVDTGSVLTLRAAQATTNSTGAMTVLTGSATFTAGASDASAAVRASAPAARSAARATARPITAR